ncbi:WD40-repeat-containing domain protein [Mycena olivaceomarginata]|nr:WD40-repeat-containing domain protein [Mycena olivaceomarginata]
MLALTTTLSLSLADPLTLKRPPSSLASCLALLSPCAASAWSPDNLYLFLASANTIHQYNPALNSLTDIYSSPDTITHLVCKSKSSLAFATPDKIHVLESTNVVQTFDSTAPTSLALANDLLAYTSADSAHVYNILLGSHTTLRGINLAGQRITTCAFHPHSRARLLLGTIPMNDASTGDIVAVACSPFSKTLVAVASSSGSVGLVDLDKEKGLFRTLNLKVPLTSAAFSPSGESLYLGTENGKLLIMDLRALDKPPKAVVIGEGGHRIQTMTVQKKIKGSTDPATTTKVSTTDETRRPSPAAPTAAPNKAPAASKVGPSPPKPRIAQIGVSPRRPSASPRVTSRANPKIFSPPRDARGNNTSVDDVSTQSSRKRDTAATATPEVKVRARQLLSSKDAESISAVSRTRKTSITESASARPRAVASAARVTSDSVSAKSTRSRSGAASRSSVPAVPPLPAHVTARSANAVLATPEAKRWIEAGEKPAKGKGKGKSVLFKEGDEENVPEDEMARERERERSDLDQAGMGHSTSWAPSPLRNAVPSSPAGGSSSAHDLLRTIVRDALLDFQQDQRAEMMGMHLDLLRLGRGWKRELRETMDEYVGDLRELREENKRLREENELLRRGY